MASEFENMNTQWLGAHNREEVVAQPVIEPGIATMVIGAGLDDRLRGDLIGAIASLRPDLCIHLKDRNSGSTGHGNGAVREARRTGEASRRACVTRSTVRGASKRVDPAPILVMERCTGVAPAATVICLSPGSVSLKVYEPLPDPEGTRKFLKC